jgi:hypothetical protein
VRLQVANKDSYSPEQVIPSKRKKKEKKKRALWLGIYPSIHLIPWLPQVTKR